MQETPLSALVEELRVTLSERQKASAAGDFPDESRGRKGAFKIGFAFSAAAKQVYGDKLEKVLFKRQRELINAIPRDDLPKIWKKDNMADAQDVIARNPKKAFQMFLVNVHRVSPKLGKLVRAVPENASLYFYAIMLRVSGRDMADIILKKYFSTTQEYKPKSKK